jgi:hypothetical protein
MVALIQWEIEVTTEKSYNRKLVERSKTAEIEK